MLIEALCSINSGQADKGDIIDVCADVGKTMIANGSGRQVDGPGKSAKKLVSPKDEQEKLIAKAKAVKTAKVEAEARRGAILDAMKMIVEEGEDLTQEGKPEVKAIEGILGYDISAQERDDLMDELEDKQED